MKASQFRAARGFLGYPRTVLAQKLGVSAETIKNIENNIYSPSNKTQAAADKLFFEQGIGFFEMPGGIIGVMYGISLSKDSLLLAANPLKLK